MKNDARKEQFKNDDRKSKHIVGNNTRSQQVAGAHRSDVEATQNPLFAKQNECSAQPPETAHHIESHDRTEVKSAALWNAFGKDAKPEKEESERHDNYEKEEHLVAERNLDAHARQSGEVFQSRSLLPVNSMKTSSRDGVAISRLTSSLPPASRCFTRETIVCGGRWECRT